MNIITRPTVTVVGSPSFHQHPKYRVPRVFMPPATGNWGVAENALGLGAFAAKGCYDSFGENGRPCEENQRQIIQQRHGSVLEHLNFSVFVEGITRACSLELNRHRQLAISQRSTRYTEEDGAALVLEPYYADMHTTPTNPPGVMGRREDGLHESQVYAAKQLVLSHIKAAEAALKQYQYEVQFLMELNPLGLSGTELRKWARGKARNILPHGLETRATYTGNLRTWRWVIESRSSRHAEDEVRRLAHHLFMALTAVAPLYFEDFTSEMVRGIPELTTPNSKI